MSRKNYLICAVMAMFVAVNAFAQERPDFSGRWTVEPEPTPAAPVPGTPPRPRVGNMGSGWGPAINVKQTATHLTVEYDFFARGDMQAPLKFNFSLDGNETINSVMMGRGIQVQTSKAAWTGSDLVITTTHTVENPAGKTDVKQKLSLESPGTLIIETTRDGTTTRTIYKKA